MLCLRWRSVKKESFSTPTIVTMKELTLWKRILPRSGFGKVSPEMTSRRSINLSPLRKSSSILSMAVPAFLKWLLHHAVKVYMEKEVYKISIISVARHRIFSSACIREISRIIMIIVSHAKRCKIIKKCRNHNPTARESQMSHLKVTHSWKNVYFTSGLTFSV